ncbi:hypothetical protein WUBG_15510, partial [Wuchereria bancrofti]
MYWKRSMDALKAQYKRWRHSRTRRRGRRRGISWNQEISSVPQLAVQNSMIKNSSAEQPDTDDLDNEFTDTLFANLMQPYTFPDPKEITQGCNADVMQPGLLSLQPSIEEIMASLVRRPDKDKSRRTPYCYFTVPDDDSTHVKFT